MTENKQDEKPTNSLFTLQDKKDLHKNQQDKTSYTIGMENSIGV